LFIKLGLQPQHLAGIKLITELSKGELVGGKLQSTEITFVPKDHTFPQTIIKHNVDTHTAG
jgi:RNA 3'-terminal phosphate cyclase